MTRNTDSGAVVVTGASGGIGRATASAFGAREAPGWPCWPEVKAAWPGPRADDRRRPGEPRCPIAVDVATTPTRWTRAARIEEAELGPDRRLGQRRVHLGVRAVLARSTRRSSGG